MEVIGLDHLYVTVSDFRRSERFYDALMERLGFRKGDTPIGGAPHAHYFNRHMQYSIRPAHDPSSRHDPYAPGLHHVCFQVRDRAAVDRAFGHCRELGIDASAPRLFPEYAPDYYATFFSDPDGVRLEIVARRSHRDAIVRDWDRFETFLNPVQHLRDRDEPW